MTSVRRVKPLQTRVGRRGVCRPCYNVSKEGSVHDGRFAATISALDLRAPGRLCDRVLEHFGDGLALIANLCI